MSRHSRFDTSRIQLGDLSSRDSQLRVSDCIPLASPRNPLNSERLTAMCQSIRARARRAPVIVFLGAHPIKLGLARYLIDLIERGFIHHIATNGAGLIHDFELAYVGETSEDVARWIKVGQFGLWLQTARLNDIIREAAQRDEGLGEAIGRVIEEERFPHRGVSIAAACWRKGIPCTGHVSIGSDIIHAMPNCSGSALGQTSYADFLVFAHTVARLDGGAFLNIGSAVAGPEVFLKALSMARNVAHQHGKKIRDFVTGVFDLIQLPEHYRDGPPCKGDPLYYFRPWKTLLCRTVADGGESYYVCGDHAETLPALWHGLVSEPHGLDGNMESDESPCVAAMAAEA
jgi:hypothetical protein